jgi:serine/threonine protein phosphatase PrpC
MTSSGQQQALRWWRASATGIIGPRHVAEGKPLQDAWHAATTPDRSQAVAVVADGHGGAKYVRSDRGSQLAVAVVRDILLRSSSAIGMPITELAKAAEQALPTRIVDTWLAAVEADIAANPGADAVAYGSTVIGAYATMSFLIVVQLGDGGSLIVYEYVDDSGKVVKVVSESIFPDEGQIGTGTRSLCSSNAHKYVRVRVFDLTKTRVRMVFLATDGFETSYPTREGFEKVGTDLEAIARETGTIDYLKNNLEAWLRTAASYTGDDASAAYLFLGAGRNRPLVNRRKRKPKKNRR